METKVNRLIEYFTSMPFIASVAVLIAGLALIGIAKRASRIIKEKRAGTPRQSAYIDSVYRVIKAVVLVIMVIAIMQCNNIPVGRLVAGVGVASIVVGFALQDTLKDLMMGLHIIGDESFKAGDCVLVAGHEGVVQSFTVLTTQLQDLDDGTTVFIPNRAITEVARSFGYYDFDIKISSSENYIRVKEVFESCSEELEELDNIKGAIFRGCAGYENDAVIYRERIYFRPAEKYTAKQAAMNVIHRYIQENDIELYARRVYLLNRGEDMSCCGDISDE